MKDHIFYSAIILAILLLLFALALQVNDNYINIKVLNAVCGVTP